jgi:hypothetical protein
MQYLEVPVPIREQPVPERALRAPPSKSVGRPAGATSSLGLPSISDTPSIKPSEIAWNAYRICSQLTKEKYGKLISEFCLYMDMCDNSGFRARGIAPTASCKAYSKVSATPTNDSGMREISGPLLNRWHPKRRAGWLAKMYQLALWYEANRIDGCTLISLTGYQENSGLSLYDTWDNINESRVKLLKILRKYLGKIDYFWVVEPHTLNNTGYPHYHLAVFAEVDNNIRDSNGEGMEDKLRRLYSKEWGTGSHTYGLSFKVMKGENSVINLKNYLMKYISKGYVSDAGWSEGEIIFNAHLYGASHGYREQKPGDMPDKKGHYNRIYRLIGMSQNLSRLLKPEEEEREQIVWLHVDETEPQEYKNDKGEIETMEVRKPLYDRLLIPDFIDTWRELAPVQSWASQVLDEKAARRARNKATAW